jgi:hypothetical protein
VEDVEFDPGSGTILEVDLEDQGTVPGHRLIGLGAYALIVTEAGPAS